MTIIVRSSPCPAQGSRPGMTRSVPLTAHFALAIDRTAILPPSGRADFRLPA